MKTIKSIIILVGLICAGIAQAQTLDVAALKGVSPAVMRQVYEISRNVKLTGEQQLKLAHGIEKENKYFLQDIAESDGMLSVRGAQKLAKMRDQMLADVLSEDELAQYYRGYFDKEADAEGQKVANELRSRYALTDQNWKFIRIAFYKIGLESRVISKMMADQPKKAAKRIEEIKREYLTSIEEKGGLRVNPDMTITWVREFNPNALRKE